MEMCIWSVDVKNRFVPVMFNPFAVAISVMLNVGCHLFFFNCSTRN